MKEMNTFNEMLDAAARKEITLAEAEQWVREGGNGTIASLLRFEAWGWDGHADLATINETVLWPLKRIFTEEAKRAQKTVTYTAPVYRFTCPRCGEHRDTTITGHCDDCEA